MAMLVLQTFPIRWPALLIDQKLLKSISFNPFLVDRCTESLWRGGLSSRWWWWGRLGLAKALSWTPCELKILKSYSDIWIYSTRVLNGDAFCSDFYNLCRFLTDIYSEAHPGPSLRLKKTVQVLIPSKPFQPVTCQFQVETHRVLLREGAGVNLTLTIGSGTSPWMMKWKTRRTKWLLCQHFSGHAWLWWRSGQLKLLGTSPQLRRVSVRGFPRGRDTGKVVIEGLSFPHCSFRLPETQTWLIAGFTPVFTLLRRLGMVGLSSGLLSSMLNLCCSLGLKPLDIEFMKQLHDKINIIPVIGKADTMTPEEVENVSFTEILASGSVF